jgi:hypothetical protein
VSTLDGRVEVSRRICASADEIFQVLADPRRHLDLDGSEMVRGSVTDHVVTAVGDVFVMKMYYSEIGPYEMNNHVVEYELNRHIGWEPEAGHGHPDVDSATARWGHRWSYHLVPDGSDATIVTERYDCSHAPEEERSSIDNGRIWIDGMTKTLERLDALCTGQSSVGDGADNGQP